jgi:hypothetical protein
MTVQNAVDAINRERAGRPSARRQTQPYATSSPIDGAWGQPSITYYTLTLSPRQGNHSLYLSSSARLSSTPDTRKVQSAQVLALLASIRNKGEAGNYDTHEMMNRETMASQWIEGIDASGHL